MAKIEALTELSEDAHVGALQANAGLQQRNELLKQPPALVKLRHLLQVVRVDDDVEAAQLRQPELALFHTRITHLRATGTQLSSTFLPRVVYLKGNAAGTRCSLWYGRTVQQHIG